MAIDIPPPMHNVARPRLREGSFSIKWTKVTSTLAPEQPT